MTTLVLPYRDDEYGVPVLQFSESDSDSDSETTVSKPKTNKTLPSIGPPQILQVSDVSLSRCTFLLWRHSHQKSNQFLFCIPIKIKAQHWNRLF